MRRILAVGFLMGGCIAVGLGWENADQKRKVAFTVGKDTTHASGPLDKDGYVDYAAALNEQLGKGVTPKNNANVLLWKALGPKPEDRVVAPEFFQLLGMEPPTEKGDYFTNLARFTKVRLELSPEERTATLDQLSPACLRSWTAKQYPHLAAWLKVNEKPLAQVVEATRCSEYFNPVVPTRGASGSNGLISAVLPGVWKCRELGQALAARALWHVAEGRTDAAWQDLLACHRLARLVARGSTLLESLVGFALDVYASFAGVAFLEHAPLTAKQLGACLRDLQALPAFPAIAAKMDLGERYMYLDIVLMMDRRGIEILDSLSGETPTEKPDPKLKQLLANVDWDPALRTANRWFDRIVTVLRVKERLVREKQLADLTEELRVLRDATAKAENSIRAILTGRTSGKEQGRLIGDILVSRLLPAFHKLPLAADRGEQHQRTLQVAFALASYRRDHNSYPKQLEDLTPKYLASVPGDLFSGKALVYRATEKGYLLYSVGPNGRDDGGRRFDDDPPGDDLRIRIPQPELKRRE